jgi:hypothetical protein
MGLYIVLVFFAAQFVAFFGYSGLGQILAVLGADVLVALNLDNPLVFVPVHPDVLLREPDARLGERAVGGDGADLRADAHDDRVQPRGDPGGVPHRRQRRRTSSRR